MKEKSTVSYDENSRFYEVRQILTGDLSLICYDFYLSDWIIIEYKITKSSCLGEYRK